MAEQNQGAQGQQIPLKIEDQVLKGVYANMMQVAHTAEEFVLDFMNVFPPSGIVSARVMVSPAHMKRIVAALQENVKRYEQQFGEIKTNQSAANPTTTSSSDHRFGFDTGKAK